MALIPSKNVRRAKKDDQITNFSYIFNLKIMVATLAHCNLILTNYICTDPVSKGAHNLRVQVDTNLGGRGGHQGNPEGIGQDDLASS